MANPGTPDPIPGGDIPWETPPRPFPGERPLGPDEPSAPYEDAPIDEPVEPGTGPITFPVHLRTREYGPEHGPACLRGAGRTGSHRIRHGTFRTHCAPGRSEPDGVHSAPCLFTGDPAQKAQAENRAADALAKAQGIPADQAKAQIQDYKKQYEETVATAKVKAEQAAVAAKSAATQGAFYGALALILGALAGFLGGRMGAVALVGIVDRYETRRA